VATTSLAFRAILGGTIAGAAILGLGGRLATAALAAMLDVPANLSAAGLAESTVAGALAGALGGAVLVPLRRTLPPGPLRGLGAAAAPFAATLVLAGLRGRAVGGANGALTVVVAAVAFACFGLLLDSWLGEDPDPDA